jgi:O-antigen/teichoic acid export membrane protein
VAFTVAGQLAVAIGGLLLYRLIAINKGASGVASYTLVKQLVVFLFPAVMLGMQTAIPRYVALSEGEGERPEPYLLAAIAPTALTATLICVLLVSSPRATASVLFGNSGRTSLVIPLVATLVATLVLEIVAGYLRGRLAFGLGMGLRVVGVASLPVILLVALPGEPIGTLISLMAVGLLVLCIPLAAVPLVRSFGNQLRVRAGSARRTLLAYGVRRIPGDFASVALFALTPAVAVHFASLRQVAYLSAGLQVLAIVTITFQPVGLVSLPYLTSIWASEPERARRYVAQLAACAAHLALFATPQVLLFADVAAKAWLGPSFADAGSVIRLTVVGVPLYISYLILRAPLDAAAVTSYNSRNTLYALLAAAATATVMLGAAIVSPIDAVALSFSVGIVVGGLTFLSARSLFDIPRSAYASIVAVVLAGVAAAIGALVKAVLVGPNATLLDLLLIAALEIGLLALFVVGLARNGVSWPPALWDRLLRKTPSQ